MLKIASRATLIATTAFICACSSPSDRQLDRIFDDERSALETLVAAFRDHPDLQILWIKGFSPKSADVTLPQLEEYRAAMQVVSSFRVDGHKTELRVLLDSRGSQVPQQDCDTGFLYKADRLSSEAPSVESLERGQAFSYSQLNLVALSGGWYRFRSEACDA